MWISVVCVTSALPTHTPTQVLPSPFLSSLLKTISSWDILESVQDGVGRQENLRIASGLQLGAALDHPSSWEPLHTAPAPSSTTKTEQNTSLTLHQDEG